MNAAEIICPECNELNLIDPDDLADLGLGDVLECEACGAFLEVVNLDPVEVELTDTDGEDAYLVVCPRCHHENEALEVGEDVECENCGHLFTPDWSEIELEDIDDDRLHHDKN